MKTETKQWSPLQITAIIFAVTTLVAAIFSILNIDSYPYRIITQASLFIMMTFSGLNALVNRKQKLVGYFSIGVSAYILFVLIYTVWVGIEIGKF